MHHKLIECHVLHQGRLLAILRVKQVPTNQHSVDVEGVVYDIVRIHHKNRIIQIFVTKPGEE